MLTAARLLLVTVALLALGSPVLGRDATPSTHDETIYAPSSLFTDTYTVDHPIVFNLTRWANPTGYRVWRLSESLARELTTSRHLLASQLPSEPAAVGVPKRGVANTNTAELAPLPPGEYLAVVQIEGASSRVLTFAVSSLGLLAYALPDHVVVTAIDLRTARVRSDVSFRAESGSDAVYRADRAGQATLPAAGGTATIVGRADDGSVARSSVYVQPLHQTDSLRYIVVTDRPVYRPGDTVDVRIIARAWRAGVLAVESGTRDVEMDSPREGAPVWKGLAKLNRFGTASIHVPLPSEGDIGTYYLNVGSEHGFAVRVAAYRKPEFTVAVDHPKHVTSGEPLRLGADVHYLFGRPVAGADVNATIAYAQHALPSLQYGFTLKPDTSPAPINAGHASAQTNRNGQAAFSVRAPVVTWPTTASISVDARDASGRTVTSSGEVLVTPSDIDLAVSADRRVSVPGMATTITVHARDFDGHALTGTTVSLHVARATYVTGQVGEDEVTDARVVIDAQGTGDVVLKPAMSGYFRITANARDDGGRAAHAETSLWVNGSDAPAYPYRELTLTPARSSAAPGGTADLLVTSPIADADLVIATSGGDPGGQASAVYVRHLTGAAGVVSIPVPAGVSDFSISAAAANSAAGLVAASAHMTVVPTPHRLIVRVTPDRTVYRPGDAAHFAIHAQDAVGHPVQAEVDLTVIDNAVYALAGPDSTDMFDLFYKRSRYAPVTGSWLRLNSPVPGAGLQTIGSTQSRSAATLGGGGILNSAWSAIASVPGVYVAPGQAGYIGVPAFDEVRADFRDTAFWTPGVVTDASGNADVSFRWPDSLTSFNAESNAVTTASDFGTGDADVLVTKPYLVRLATPRFLRTGDAATVTTIAHGLRAAKVSVFRLRAPALGIDDTTRVAHYDANATAALPWKIYGGEIGRAGVELAGASGGEHDALRISLPVEAAGVALHDRSSGSLPNDTRERLVLPRDQRAGDVRLTLAPSRVAALAEAVRLLDAYPYACVEQTMSAALPAVALERAHVGTSGSAGLTPAKVAAHAIKRLVELQHPDGAWGWWEHDASNPFMTAYALYGLAELARDGNAVPADTLDRGVRAVDAQFAAETTPGLFHASTGNIWNTRAYLLFALADARPSAVDADKLHAVDAHLNEMNDYGLAVLGLAHVASGDRPGAQLVLDALMLRGHAQDGLLWWTDGGWHYGWTDDPVEATAYAVRLLHALRPNDERLPHALTWLQTRERGSWFGTTKDTAAAILTLIETAQPGELHPDETVTIALNGRHVRSLAITTPVLSASRGTILIPAAAVRHGGVLTFARTGRGALYWSVDWMRYGAENAHTVSDSESAPAGALDVRAAAPFTIERIYHAPHPGAWRTGDEIGVSVTVRASSTSEFLAIEDPLPAGVEYQPAQGDYARDDWSGLQFFDDRVVFFAQNVSPERPINLHYTMRVTTAGTYTAPAPSAYAMYGPPVTALGKAERVTIVSAGGAP